MNLYRAKEYPIKQESESIESYVKRFRNAVQEESSDRIQDFDILQLGNVPWVDVREYGTKGDGSTDDTTAIQAAIDSITTGVVFFPTGTYMTDALNYKSGITFRGCGAGSTTLKLNTTQDTPVFTRSDAVMEDNYTTVNALSAIYDVTIRDLTLDGNYANQTDPETTQRWDFIILMQRVIRPKVINCVIKDGAFGGINLHQCRYGLITQNFVKNGNAYGSYQNNVMTYKDFTAGLPPGISADSKGGNHIIVNNWVDVEANVGQGYNLGISCTGDTGTLIANNVVIPVTGAKGYWGISSESNHSRIIGNHIFGMGININDATSMLPKGTIVAFNQIYNPSTAYSSGGHWGIGIHVSKHEGAIIANNAIYKTGLESGASGTFSSIFLNDSPNFLIHNNRVCDVDDALIAGIIILGSSTNSHEGSVCENYIESRNADGLYLSTANYCRVSNNGFVNTHSSATLQGVQTVSSNAMISNNYFKNYNTGISADDSGTGNILNNNSFSGCTNNVVEGTQGNAIYGLSGARKIYQAAAAPTAGTWAVGDICWDTNPAAGATPGWVCTTAGTPGTWKAMASLAA